MGKKLRNYFSTIFHPSIVRSLLEKLTPIFQMRLPSNANFWAYSFSSICDRASSAVLLSLNSKRNIDFGENNTKSMLPADVRISLFTLNPQVARMAYKRFW